MTTTTTNTTITVEYALIDGAHFFTGVDDKHACGLCVAHTDLKVAYDEVSVQLSNLLEINHSIKAKVVPDVSFETFKEWVEASKPPPSPKIKPKADIGFGYASQVAA